MRLLKDPCADCDNPITGEKFYHQGKELCEECYQIKKMAATAMVETPKKQAAKPQPAKSSRVKLVCTYCNYKFLRDPGTHNWMTCPYCAHQSVRPDSSLTSQQILDHSENLHAIVRY